ncbi:acyltransferase [uncultured Cellulomonas sp.]|uniref:acyltransferase family protein n=1 Tax=uncultured Cellulomonas sp. TaxID=189682 RepID=UPI0028E79DC8|nr:acyltransferase [uncultured Cellulomonas sp.]
MSDHEPRSGDAAAVVAPTTDVVKTRRVYSLQWLRFVAALAVVVYHAAVYQSLMLPTAWAVQYVPGWLGAVGVSLFFALSGYLMSSAMQRYDAPQFLLHRLVRIYPPFFVVVALVLVAAIWSPIKPPVDGFALSLLPYGGGTYPLGVEWTLVFEIAFYVFVAVLIVLRRERSAASVLVAWLGLVLVHNVVWPDDPSIVVFPAHDLPFVGVTTGFAFGMLLPLVLRTWAPHPVVALIVATALWQYGSSQGITGGRWGLGLGSALVVLSLARFQGWQPVFGDTPVGRLGNRLGNYSYMLYLVHVPVIRTLYATVPGIGYNRVVAVALVAAVLASIPLGELDVRMYRRLKARVDASSPTVRTVLAGAFVLAFAVSVVVFF